ncbi:hypothetical protein TFLX_01084 [Thermoflexales bacterium]|nr:hypothetical protein TFLX_01084 [Thermoflexales bacterium]
MATEALSMLISLTSTLSHQGEVRISPINNQHRLRLMVQLEHHVLVDLIRRLCPNLNLK